ncbi:hypothetical protein PPERSA_05472 [Pseudocohnilembus persalinus]|uniref:Uncharacterized protein n=1 Tax=Pseudocohnilembus persalinus TaxID=266149 RepID=A0A0V0R835_PSEPJ|nr:hypothetical protein PPERSA_05472 [Pseudocohnilembus persalinus]|eukprot:KRX10652.1 hypothetical protein PPERSA_05472 [Pseudocohnilembus persalinus]
MQADNSDLTFCTKCKKNSVRNDNVQGIAVCKICRLVKFQHLINTEDEVRFKDQEEEQDSGKNLSRTTQLQEHPVYGVIEDIIQIKGQRRKFTQEEIQMKKEINKVLDMEKKIKRVLQRLTDKEGQSAVCQFHQIILKLKEYEKEDMENRKKNKQSEKKIKYEEIDIQADAAIAVCMTFIKLYEGCRNLRQPILKEKVRRKFKVPKKKFYDRYEFLQENVKVQNSYQIQNGYTELIELMEKSDYFSAYQRQNKEEYMQDKEIFKIIYDCLYKHNQQILSSSKNKTQAGVLLLYFQKCLDQQQLQNKIYAKLNSADITDLTTIQSNTLEKKLKEVEDKVRMEPIIRQEINNYLQKNNSTKYM